MHIGIPREVKTLEGRVALVPEACAELIRAGHRVSIETGAGLNSGYPDAAYQQLGVSVTADADALYGEAELIVKVKEPVEVEFKRLRAGHRLFCFLHLAAEPALARKLCDIGLTAIGFETVQEGRALPLLAPMSDIAGRLAVQIGAWLLQAPQGGKGLLLGGLPAAERGHVVILGGGVAGGNAALVAASLGARVTIFDPSRDKLQQLRALGANVTALYPYASAIADAVGQADLLIGAVLVPGGRTPHLVSADLVRRMAPGSVVVDISVDQGGCIETIHPTTYAEPTYLFEGVLHFGVTNMPGAVPRSASQTLSAALMPYVLALAAPGWERREALAGAINVSDGRIVHPAVREALGRDRPARGAGY